MITIYPPAFWMFALRIIFSALCLSAVNSHHLGGVEAFFFGAFIWSLRLTVIDDAGRERTL